MDKEQNTIPSLAERIKDSSREATVSLHDYINLLNNEGCFVIPDYQRGYIWGQRKKNNPVDSVTVLIRTLKDAFITEKDVFLQGITAHGITNSYDICLVDGQQRTTFFYLLLKFLGYEGYLKIKYNIRTQSNYYLCHLNFEDISNNDDEDYQDVFFFKRTLRIFRKELDDCNHDKFLNYILKHVRFLFVVIPVEQSKIVFTMMNGNKAKMTEEELIKAELLRCASLKKDDRIEEAEHSEIRGRLAREWDRWLYWWNDEDVKTVFRTDKQLGWLLPLVCNSSKVSFDDFREKLLNEQSIKQSKAVFKRMRLLQKSIEDTYNHSQSYNYLGVILYIRNSAELRFAFLRWFFSFTNEKPHPKSESELKRYYNWSIIGVNHEDIIANRIDKYNECRRDFLSNLESNHLFLHYYETAYRWLIRQNIKQDNIHDGRKFDFSIERDRSLEHIYPKSKIGHRNEDDIALGWDDKPLDKKQLPEIKLWRKDMEWECPNDKHVYHGSEHCIGNMVLLYKRDNSKFNDADFKQKNQYFFRDMDDDAFKSRHLIHTTMIFSDISWEENCTKSSWNKEQIPQRKYEEIKEFKNEYPELTGANNE